MVGGASWAMVLGVDEYIEPMFRQFFEGLAAAVPGQCAVCRAWPAQPVCEACVARFAQPRPRCRRCALPVPLGIAECGRCIGTQDAGGKTRYRWVDTHNIWAIGFDQLIPGNRSPTVNHLRLWAGLRPGESLVAKPTVLFRAPGEKDPRYPTFTPGLRPDRVAPSREWSTGRVVWQSSRYGRASSLTSRSHLISTPPASECC